MDLLTDFFQDQGSETIERGDEALSETIQPSPPQSPELAIAQEPDAVVADGEGYGITTDDHSERLNSPVMDSSDHGSSILSKNGGEDSEWSKSHKRKMLKRVNSLLDAASPGSKKPCKRKRKVMDAYKEISAAYSALGRLLAAKSTPLGSGTRGSLSLHGASNLHERDSEPGFKRLDSGVHQTLRSNTSSCVEGFNQDPTNRSVDLHDQRSEPLDYAQLRQRDDCHNQKKVKGKELRRSGERTTGGLKGSRRRKQHAGWKQRRKYLSSKGWLKNSADSARIKG